MEPPENTLRPMPAYTQLAMAVGKGTEVRVRVRVRPTQLAVTVGKVIEVRACIPTEGGVGLAAWGIGGD